MRVLEQSKRVEIPPVYALPGPGRPHWSRAFTAVLTAGPAWFPLQPTDARKDGNDVQRTFCEKDAAGQKKKN